MMTFEEFAGGVTRAMAGRYKAVHAPANAPKDVEWAFERGRARLMRDRHYPIRVRLEGSAGKEPYEFVASTVSEELIVPVAETILKYISHPTAKA